MTDERDALAKRLDIVADDLELAVLANNDDRSVAAEARDLVLLTRKLVQLDKKAAREIGAPVLEVKDPPKPLGLDYFVNAFGQTMTGKERDWRRMYK